MLSPFTKTECPSIGRACPCLSLFQGHAQDPALAAGVVGRVAKLGGAAKVRPCLSPFSFSLTANRSRNAHTTHSVYRTSPVALCECLPSGQPRRRPPQGQAGKLKEASNFWLAFLRLPHASTLLQVLAHHHRTHHTYTTSTDAWDGAPACPSSRASAAPRMMISVAASDHSLRRAHPQGKSVVFTCLLSKSIRSCIDSNTCNSWRR